MSLKQGKCKYMKEWPGVIQSGMLGLLKQQKLCDVLITTKDGSIKCHKVALAAHSSLMARLISDYAPEDVVRIRLPAYTMSTVKVLLNFMYTSDAELCPDNISQVTGLSIKLGLMAILDACKTYLVKHANPENVILNYSIALNNSLQDTAQILFSYITDNMLEISKSPQFLYLSLERLIPIVQCNKLNVCCEMDVFRAVVNWVNFDRVSRVPQAKRLMALIHFEDIFADELIQETERSHWLLSECSPVRDIIFDVIRHQCIRSKNNFCGLSFPHTICNLYDDMECCSNYNPNCCSACVHNHMSDNRCHEECMACPLKFRNNICGNNMNLTCSPVPHLHGVCESSSSDDCFPSSPSFLKKKLIKEPETFLNRQYDQFKEINGIITNKSSKRGKSKKVNKKNSGQSLPSKSSQKKPVKVRPKSNSSTVSGEKHYPRFHKETPKYSTKTTSDESSVKIAPSEASTKVSSNQSIQKYFDMPEEKMSHDKSKKRRKPYSETVGSRINSKKNTPRTKDSKATSSSSKVSSSRHPPTHDKTLKKSHKSRSRDKQSYKYTDKSSSKDSRGDYSGIRGRERIHERHRTRERGKRQHHSNMNNMSSDDPIYRVKNTESDSIFNENSIATKTNSKDISRQYANTTDTSSRETTPTFLKHNSSKGNYTGSIVEDDLEKKLTQSSKYVVHSTDSDFMMYYNLASRDAPYLLMIGGLDLQKVDSDIPGRFIMALSVGSIQRGRGSWIRVSMQLEQFLHHHQAAVIRGKLYLIGGAIFNPEKPNRLGVATDGVTIFNFRTGQWRLGPPMITPRAYFGMARWHDRLIVVGGENNDTTETDQIDYYDTSSDSWGILTRHPGGPRLGVAASVLKNVLYVVGGYSESRNNRGEIMADSYSYNLMTGQWSILSYLDNPISHATLVVLNNSTLILAGGRTVVNGQKGSSTNAVMAYYDTRNVWRQVGQLSVGRHDMASAVVKVDNSRSWVYLIGGMSNPNPAALKLVECLSFDEEQEMATVVKVTNCPYAVTGAAGCLVK